MKRWSKQSYGKCWNRGVGSKLIDFVCEKHQPQLLIAETDYDAVGFYRKYGFAVTTLGEKYPGCVRYLCKKERGISNA